MTTLSKIGTKFQVGAAACAAAGAAILMPGAVANASPVAPMPAAGLGSSLTCDDTVDDCSVFGFESNGASAVASGVFQNNFIWFGDSPDQAPENIAVFEFNAIPLFPEALQTQLYGFWENINPNGFTACVLGLSYSVNPYSTMTVGLTRGCEG